MGKRQKKLRKYQKTLKRMLQSIEDLHDDFGREWSEFTYKVEEAVTTLEEDANSCQKLWNCPEGAATDVLVFTKAYRDFMNIYDLFSREFKMCGRLADARDSVASEMENIDQATNSDGRIEIGD
jgi:hypothetical protein